MPEVKVYINNKAEDVPNLITMLLKHSNGSGLAWILRPTEKRSALLLMTAESSQASLSNAVTDCPGPLNETLTPDKAALLLKSLMAIEAASEISHKSQWKGDAINVQGNIVLKLTRKLNSYTLLTIANQPDERRWVWSVETDAYNGRFKEKKSGSSPWLQEAISMCIEATYPLVGNVCKFKETMRPQKLTPELAATNPIKPAAVPRSEPIQTFSSKLKPSKPKDETTSKASGKKAADATKSSKPNDAKTNTAKADTAKADTAKADTAKAESASKRAHKPRTDNASTFNPIQSTQTAPAGMLSNSQSSWSFAVSNAQPAPQQTPAIPTQVLPVVTSSPQPAPQASAAAPASNVPDRDALLMKLVTDSLAGIAQSL